MPHIHNEPGQHDITASAFIINVSDKGSPKVLLHKHKITGKLMQPGGHIELDEDPWQAIIREIGEETGYDISQLKVLQSAPNIQKNPESNATYLPIPVVFNHHRFNDTDHFHDDLAFAFLTTELPNNEPNEGETREFRWVNLAELVAIPLDEIIKNSQEIYKFILENFKDWRAQDIDNFDKEEK